MVTLKSKNIETIENEVKFKCHCGKRAVGWINCKPYCKKHYDENKISKHGKN